MDDFSWIKLSKINFKICICSRRFTKFHMAHMFVVEFSNMILGHSVPAVTISHRIIDVNNNIISIETFPCYLSIKVLLESAV